MMNLKLDYECEKGFEAAYKIAEANGDETEMQNIRDAYHTWSEQVDDNGQDYANLYRIYSDSKNRGNDRIDLSEPYEYRDAEHLIDLLRMHGIEEFTFSSGWSSAVESAWEFQKAGCKLVGLIEINGRCKAFMSDEYEKVPAYLFKTC